MRRRRISAVVVLTAILVLFGSPLTVYADDEFDTKNYSVEITVNENQSYEISEKIQVNFPTEKHGIYRYVPYSGMLHNLVEGKDIPESYVAKVKKIDVANDPFETSDENSSRVIKIGDADTLLTGEHTYDISYEYQMYNDKDNGYDTFYLNVIPSEWETSIDSASVTIHMPKTFDESQVEVFAGNYGEDREGIVQYTVSDKDITIVSQQALEKGEGITARVMLPEGYFTGVPSTLIWGKVAMIWAIVCGIALLILWVLFGRKPMVIRSVEIRPPEGLSSAELGYVIDGVVQHRDMMSLIIYFASKGYLEIQEQKGGETYLRKIKDLPENIPDYQRIFFDGLFKGKKVNGKLSITEIPSGFYEQYDKSKSRMVDIYQGDRSIEDGNCNTARFVMFCILECLVVIGGMFYSLQSADIYGTVGFIFPALFYGIVYWLENKFYVPRYARQYGKKLFGIILVLIGSFIAVGAECLCVWVMSLDGGAQPVYAAVSALGFLGIYFMHRRTKYGAEIQGKVLGFREFLETAEKDRLEFLVEENPSFFYDILPYAYALDVTKKWVKRFEDIPIAPPVWYQGDLERTMDIGTRFVFLDRVDRMTESLHSQIDVSRPSESSSSYSGGSDGGGFSGGGSGGGGGGAW